MPPEVFFDKTLHRRVDRLPVFGEAQVVGVDGGAQILRVVALFVAEALERKPRASGLRLRDPMATRVRIGVQERAFRSSDRSAANASDGRHPMPQARAATQKPRLRSRASATKSATTRQNLRAAIDAYDLSLPEYWKSINRADGSVLVEEYLRCIRQGLLSDGQTVAAAQGFTCED